MNIFWDWNGTVCNDLQLSFDAVNHMLHRRGRAPITMEQYYSYIDTPISKFYEHLFDFSVEPMSVLGSEFNSYYRSNAHKLCITDGVLEVIKALHGAGARQFILSSSHKSTILPLAESWGILPYFESVLGAEDWSVGPKDERARCFCRENGLCPDETWFIGDLLHDLETARLCGASCLLLPIGHQSTHDLQTAGESFCPSVAEILHRIGIKEVKS